MQRANKAEAAEEGLGKGRGRREWQIAVAQQPVQLVAKLGIEIIVI